MKFSSLFQFSFCSSLAYLVIGSFLSFLLSTIPAVANHLLTQGLPQESELEPGGETDGFSREYTPPTISEPEFRRLASRGGTSSRGRAGSRGDCPAISNGEPYLTAIVPVTQGTVNGKLMETAVGTTTTAYPTFWFYLPYPSEKLHSVRFVVNDEQDMPLFEPVTVPLSQPLPGLVSIQLPETAPPLEVGKYYRWYVMLDCTPEGGSDAFVDAYVQRIELPSEVAVQLEVASPMERIDLLIANKAWHEAVSELYMRQMQSSSDSSIQARWMELLKAGGLTSEGL